MKILILIFMLKILFLQDQQLSKLAPFSWPDFVDFMKAERSGRCRTARRVRSKNISVENISIENISIQNKRVWPSMLYSLLFIWSSFQSVKKMRRIYLVVRNIILGPC